jgi:3-dehydroquinate dehydratase-2
MSSDFSLNTSPTSADTLTSVTHSVWVINGPNLNLLGHREPQHYGTRTLEAIEQYLAVMATGFTKPNISLRFVQSNHEGELIESVHEALGQGVAGLIVNAGGYSHTSIALRDALAAFKGLKVEVHLSNVFAREAFRQESYLTPVMNGCIVGLGAEGYGLALRWLYSQLAQSTAAHTAAATLKHQG